MIVGRGEIQLVLPQSDATAGRVQLKEIVGKLAFVAPVFIAGLGVKGDHLPHRRGDEHHAIVDDRGRLVPFDHPGGEGPHRCQAFDVGGVDLVERAVALPVISPSIKHPIAGFWIFKTAGCHRAVILDRTGDGGGRDKASERDEVRQ